jgi:hypothetical protein
MRLQLINVINSDESPRFSYGVQIN